MVPLNEVGAVGLTEAEARERGVDVEVVEYDMAQLAGTYVLRETYVGRAKLVLDRSSDVVVGRHFVGTGVAELTHSATMAAFCSGATQPGHAATLGG
jgi:dihydrolipoamide dehydrogenase